MSALIFPRDLKKRSFLTSLWYNEVLSALIQKEWKFITIRDKQYEDTLCGTKNTWINKQFQETQTENEKNKKIFRVKEIPSISLWYSQFCKPSIFYFIQSKLVHKECQIPYAPMKIMDYNFEYLCANFGHYSKLFLD